MPPGAGDGAAGYATIRFREDGSANVPLLGLAAVARGQGLARTLIQHAAAWSAAQGAPRIDVLTSAGNIRSQRLFQACGLRTLRAQSIHHLWLDE